jgi:DNA-binding CsgD family transcriptional regulator
LKDASIHSASRITNGSPFHTVLLVLGFACFKVAQSASYSTAMLSGSVPYIMISNIEFGIVTSFPIMLTELAVILFVFKRKPGIGTIPVAVPTFLLLLASAASALDFVSRMPPIVGFVIVCTTYGVCTSLITLAWVELFAFEYETESVHLLAFAMLLSAVIMIMIGRLSLPMLPIIALCLFAFAAFACSKVRNAMKKAHGTTFWKQATEKRLYVKGIRALGNGLVPLLALGCAMGILNSFMLVDGYAFEGSETAGNLGVLIGYATFFVIVHMSSRFVRIEFVYRILFPLLATLLFLWPLLSTQFGYPFSISFAAGYNFISVSVMFLIIREAHRRLLSPYALMAIAILFIRLSVLLGLVAGSGVAGISVEGVPSTMLIVAIVMYALALVLLFLPHSHMPVRTKRLNPTEGELFKQRSEALAQKYRLTNREKDILRHLARGRSSTYIGKELWLSPDTVRGHIKNIYVKLGVHSKQELIDMILQS